MTEFKVGDEVWFYKDVFPIHTLYDIFPRRGTILKIEQDDVGLLNIKHGDLWFYTDQSNVFHTKQEAIDALIKHLEKIRNDRRKQRYNA